ncbi:MAG TPA: M20 family metallopeptidase [Gemmatimonadaceae bacterium]|nr:M20 family metallopeptidase [Gemmatimonadaceae bacterium]
MAAGIPESTAPLPPAVASLFDAPTRASLLELRRALHADPELAFQEHRTAARLEEALRTLAPLRLERVATTGVVARFRGRRPGAPVTAIRGDIDALPIQEATGLPFSSRNPGVMHACGHDVHATWTVGAAHLLARDPAEGDVVIILQPAEETGGGALSMIEGGALSDVAAIFGGHVDRRFPVGQVVADPGPLAASADAFRIELVGRGAHAARPHESADPIVGLGALIAALHTVVSRKLDPADPGALTIGRVEAGTASNVIPELALLHGTMRAVTPRTRALLREQVRLMAEHVAIAYGLEARVTLDDGTPPVINAPDAAAWAREAATSLLGSNGVVPFGIVNLGGEDFSHYLERVPGCFLRIGAREHDGPPTPAHSPRFQAAEESIFVGAAVLAAAARTASRRLLDQKSSGSSRPSRGRSTP